METIAPDTPTDCRTPTGEKTKTHGLSDIRESIKNKGFSDKTVAIMCAGWSAATHKQYSTYLKKWETFCVTKQWNKTNSCVNNILDFLTSLFESGYSYSSINTAKSALLTIVTVNDSKDWNTNSDIVRFFKGVYNMKTPLPKYTSTWDVDTFLRFLTTLMPLHELSLKHLTLKAVSLIALVSGCRAQSIHEMNIDLCDKTHNKMCFFFKTKLKTSRPSNKAQTLIVYKYTDETLCVYRTLSAYMEKTQSLRSSQSLWTFFNHFICTFCFYQ